MPTHEEICWAVAQTAVLFPIRKASYFGSYAEGQQTEKSDLDILVEFHKPAVSLFVLSSVKNNLEDLLKIPVDVIHAPLSGDSFIKINREVQIFG